MNQGMGRSTVYALLLLIVLVGCAGVREIRLGDQFAGEGNWEAAVFVYREAVRKEPKNIELRRKLGEAKVQAAGLHYERGQQLMKQRDILLSLEEFKKAMSLDPSQARHREALQQILRLKKGRDLYQSGLKFMKTGRFSEAEEQLEQALVMDPELIEVHSALRDLGERRSAASVDEMDLALRSGEPITLKFRNAKLNEVFEFLSKTAGINILFDKDVHPEGLKVTIFIKDASFKEALSLLLTTNNLFLKKINDNTILIIPKTRQKVKQYQDLMIQTFYLSTAKAKDMVNLLRTMLETRRVFVNEGLNALVIRDTPEKIQLARKIIEANDRMVAEVMLEVEVLEVNRTDTLQLGWKFSQSQIRGRLGPIPSPGQEPGEGAFSFALEQANTIFFTLPSVIVDFFKQESEVETLANPRIRVQDGEKAKINIGDRVPILLSTSTTSAASVGIAGNTQIATNVEYRDVGIKVEVEPRIHLNGDVTMKIHLEVTSLGDKVDLGLGFEQFRFGNRSVDTVLRVADGETVVIGGLIGDEERNTINKVPGLGDLPILGRLFSSTEKGKVKTDILLTIRPRVVRGLEPPDQELQSFWSGTEESYSTTPLFSEILSVGEVDSGPGLTDTTGPRAPIPPGIPPGLAPQGFLPPLPAAPTPTTVIR